MARQSEIDVDFIANAEHVRVMPVVPFCWMVWLAATMLPGT